MGKKPAVSAATRKKLMDAFWELYTQKGIEQISIREVTDLAGYNRGTFYLYFKDIYDILNQIEDSLFQNNIMDDSGSMREHFCQMDFRQMVTYAAENFESHKKYMIVLLGEHGDPQFTYKLKQRFVTFLSALPKIRDLDSLTQEYLTEYCASGLLAMIRLWLNSEPQIPVEDFILTAIKVILPESSRALLEKHILKSPEAHKECS